MQFKEVRTFCEPAAQTINEDSYSVSDKYLLCCDGASGLFNSHLTDMASDAQWLAQRIADVYGNLLEKDTNSSMPQLCAQACDILTKEFAQFITTTDSNSDIYPSSGVAAVRLLDDKLEYYTLGDLDIFIHFKDGEVLQINDPAIVKFDQATKAEMVRLAKEKNEHVFLQRQHVQERLQAVRRLRNTPEGYAIFEPTGYGADKGLMNSISAENIHSVMIMSDGLADALTVGEFYPDVKTFVEDIEINGFEEVCSKFRTELQKDQFFDKYPRFKVEDDATGVIGFL